MNIWPFRKRQERRSATDESWQHITAGTTAAAGSMSARQAENISAVCAAVDLISTSIATCPALLYAVGKDGQRTELPSPEWLSAPNRHQSWQDFTGAILRDVLLRGNALFQICDNASGGIDELRWWPWQDVQWRIADGAITYTVVDSIGAYGPTGKRYTLLASEVAHIKDAQDNPWIGVSRLSRARRVFLNADAAHSASSSLYANAVRPSGVLATDARLDDASRSNLRTALDGFAGNANAGKMLVLDQGLKYTALAFSSEDAELLDSRRFSVEEVARVFGISPIMLGDMSKASYNVAASATLHLVTYGLKPWAAKVESAVSRAVLPAGQKLVIDLEGLAIADLATRWAAYRSAVDSGVLSVDECRALAGFNELGGEFATPRTFNAATAEQGGLNHENANA